MRKEGALWKRNRGAGPAGEVVQQLGKDGWLFSRKRNRLRRNDNWAECLVCELPSQPETGTRHVPCPMATCCAQAVPGWAGDLAITTDELCIRRC